MSFTTFVYLQILFLFFNQETPKRKCDFFLFGNRDLF